MTLIVDGVTIEKVNFDNVELDIVNFDGVEVFSAYKFVGTLFSEQGTIPNPVEVGFESGEIFLPYGSLTPTNTIITPDGMTRTIESIRSITNAGNALCRIRIQSATAINYNIRVWFNNNTQNELAINRGAVLPLVSWGTPSGGAFYDFVRSQSTSNREVTLKWEAV
jgi:hypothetical protein